MKNLVETERSSRWLLFDELDDTIIETVNVTAFDIYSGGKSVSQRDDQSVSMLPMPHGRHGGWDLQRNSDMLNEIDFSELVSTVCCLVCSLKRDKRRRLVGLPTTSDWQHIFQQGRTGESLEPPDWDQLATSLNKHALVDGEGRYPSISRLGDFWRET